MRRLSLENATRWTRVGVLAAFALVLGYLETFVPIPIPGVKIGLANIAVLLCFMRLDAGAALFVTLMKVLAQGLLFGSPLTFAYSLIGSTAAFLVMALIVRLPGMHPVMVSMCGAVAHTAGQMLVAAALLGTRFVWLAAPVLMVAALVTGALCGVLTVKLDAALERRSAEEPADAPDLVLDELPDTTRRPVGALLVAFVVFAVLVAIQEELLPLAILFALAVVACVASRVSATMLLRGLRAFAVLFVLSAVATIVSVQQGTELARLGSLAVTDEALAAVAAMALRLGAVMGASVAVMARIDRDDLIAFTVLTARRLSDRGLDTQGPLLALNVCLQTIPVLASGLDLSDVRLFGRGLVDSIAGTYAQAECLAEALCQDAGGGDA